MSAVTTRHVRVSSVLAEPDGPLVRVAVETYDGLAYRREMMPAEFGPWWHSFMTAVGGGTVLQLCGMRVRQRDGLVIAFGHWSDDQWFDPRPEHERAVERKARRRVKDALRHINAYRGGWQADLDPAAVGWSDDDVFAEARRLGWREPLR